ncbi:ABC transporter ATP-binding protein [Spelaeicoccus albus]|uniref:ABC-type quaternary amine transporter n=1 Tax=Spelaeicoccus albus TaxID=1280376 RepID=A0A7Z0D1H4_9MICO|nr:ATP-binding cassette domain-containing protein [Spelaeicoccus albus]NYI66267.1 osmoprotectant transport system ATP-binding protein [Spelaeicoccus albus]
MIRFEAVTKKFPDGTVAVDDLDLEAPTGKLTALVGPSGCGKTTTLRMINRLITPTTGRIMLGDDDTAELDPAVLRRGIGYVIQHAGLFPHRTVLGNVTAVPRLLGWSKSEARSRGMDLLERVGLDAAMAGRYPAQLSGGQQQRVGVARALAADPPVMLMDEPFSAVDPIVRAQLQDEFLRLQAELEKTIVLVTHDIDEAIKLGDQIAVFARGGHIAQMAEPATLLGRPANDFVADFVGRDRGYRALGFRQAAGLPLHTEPTVRPGTAWSDAASASLDHWILIVDDDDRPLGWTDLDRPSGDVIDSTTMNLGGTLASSNGAIREALDAALSSPSGRGVVVDGSGRFAGSVLASEVVAELANKPEVVGAGEAVIEQDVVP